MSEDPQKDLSAQRGKAEGDDGLPKDFRAANKQSVRGRAKKFQDPVWLVGLAAGILVLIFVVYTKSFEAKEPALTKPPELESAPRYDQVPAIIRDFYQAEDWRELLSFVRTPESVRPLMASWYAERPLEVPERIEILSISEGIIHPGGGSKIWLVSTMVKTDLSPEPQFVPIEKTDEGLKIDWACAVGYQPMRWLDFAREQPADVLEFRVFLSDGANSPDASSFDPKDIPLKVAVPSSVTPLYGFMRHGPYEKARARLGFQFGERPMPAIAWLRFEGEQLEIVSIHQLNWVKPPFIRSGSTGSSQSP